MNNVLVTGATGFIGYEVARQLAASGSRPRLLVRRPLRGLLFSDIDVVLVQGDLMSRESLVRAVDGIDTVIHLGARAVFEEYHIVRPSIVEGSRTLMEAAISAGVKNFVFASSFLVYGSQTAPIDAETPVGPTSGYGRAKVEAEGVLRELADRGKVALATVRLPHVYGARDLMFSQVRQGTVAFPGKGSNNFAHLHVRDAATILIEAGVQSWNGTSPVSDDFSSNWLEFFGVVHQYYPRFRTVRVPTLVALAGTYLLTPWRRIRNAPSVYTPEAVQNWNLNLPARERILWPDLGVTLAYPTIYEGIPAVMDECLQFKWVHSVADRVR